MREILTISSLKRSEITFNTVYVHKCTRYIYFESQNGANKKTSFSSRVHSEPQCGHDGSNSRYSLGSLPIKPFLDMFPVAVDVCWGGKRFYVLQLIRAPFSHRQQQTSRFRAKHFRAPCWRTFSFGSTSTTCRVGIDRGHKAYRANELRFQRGIERGIGGWYRPRQ